MNNKIGFLRTGWQSIAAVAVLVIALPLSVMAQEQTSAIRGTINAADGSPAAGASVRVTDTRTGAGRSTTTNASGVFTSTALRIGGPYTVTISSSGHASQTITDVYVALGDIYTFDITLSPDEIEEITVTAQAIDTVQVAVGPSATFTFQELQDAPAINRDITDVVRIDPRIHVDEAGNRGDSIHCGGAHHRFNSLTVDGVRLNDQFGLNSNGYPTARMPFPYDAIQQVAVEMAPFDVQYGGFTACNINAVTKSGTNEFHGQVFYDYTDDGFTGDTLEGTPVDLGSWDRTRYGLSIGGPIIKDKLFFFAAYEYLDEPELFERGPADAPAAGRFVAGVTQAQLDRIRDIAMNVYGYDPGEAVRNLPVEDEKYLLKLDWSINDDHRAALTYMYNDGFNIAESDGDSNEFEFSKHYYERGAELESFAGQWFANWTDNFSTELRVSAIDLINRQINIGDNDFGEVQIRTFNNGSSATVYLGADDSRHTNQLNWETLGFKLTGQLVVGDHTITAGLERDDLTVFNLFVQETQGEYEFESSGFCDADLTPTSGDADGAYVDGCIDAFESGDPDDITYENASGSNNPADAGVTWGYEINTAYIQDEFPLFDGTVNIVAGLRYDWYTSDDLPVENPLFIARNGFTNADNFDGESLLQPRLGFSWEATDSLTVRGGVGIYSGGNPNVWLSNNYSNTGILTAEADDSDIANRPISDGLGGNTIFNIPTTTGDGPGGNLPIWNVPQEMFDVVTNASGDFGVNAIDPNFKIPQATKFALGATYNFDFPGRWYDQFILSADFQYSKGKDDAIVIDGALEQVGTTPDGRPVYQNVDRGDPDCSPGGVLDPSAPGCGNRAFRTDYILTNVPSGNSEQTTWSFGISKSHEWGLDWTLAYTHVNSDDVSPMTSFVAFSNYASISVSDPNNPGQARSNYEFSDRITLRMQYQAHWFGDLRTSFTVFGATNAGRPSSYGFGSGGVTFGDRIDDRHLLYVPTGPSDPNVVFGPQFDTDAFFDFINGSGLAAYAGGIAPRNAVKSSWWTKFDVRIEQELPGFSPDHRFAAFLLIENFGNLLNDEWGVLYETSFPRFQSVVDFPAGPPPFFDDAGIDPVTGQYLYDRFNVPSGQSRAADASLYEIRFGVSYRF